jgi:hypothetical protein
MKVTEYCDLTMALNLPCKRESVEITVRNKFEEALRLNVLHQNAHWFQSLCVVVSLKCSASKGLSSSYRSLGPTKKLCGVIDFIQTISFLPAA